MLIWPSEAYLTHMMTNQLWKSLKVGARRRWWDGLRMAFSAVGVAWTLSEVLTKALTPLDTYLNAHGGDFLAFMATLSVVVFVACIAEPVSVTFTVPTSDTKITLKYGDLFAQNADLLIGVNEFFDGELGRAVDGKSLHGQFITRNFGGSAANFQAVVLPALAATGVIPSHTSRPVQPSQSYPIGTTVPVANGAHRAFLMAMAKTDLITFKASSDPAILWAALQGGFAAAHIHGGGAPLAMPLFGNGQAGINLAPQHLLRLLTLALVDFGRNSTFRLPRQVTVVLHDRCFEELDIREIARDWKKEV
ncbi:MAG: hypothetical protein EOO38_08820 [Cytophagaceae bacterium]|nr:MAG: hypothetical protein EOO38_08820 [Cytophagaceae bacterium]